MEEQQYRVSQLAVTILEGGDMHITKSFVVTILIGCTIVNGSKADSTYAGGEPNATSILDVGDMNTPLNLLPEKTDKHFDKNGDRLRNRGQRNQSKKQDVHGKLRSNSKSSLCDTVSDSFKDGTIDHYVAQKKDIDARETVYFNLDIDEDGMSDKLTTSSGSSESYLEVQLSSGKEYGLEESGSILVVKVNNKVYAVVTHWNSETIGVGKVSNRSLYMLNKSGVKYICSF